MTENYIWNGTHHRKTISFLHSNTGGTVLCTETLVRDANWKLVCVERSNASKAQQRRHKESKAAP